jgi:tetratricopeptide (TPR) repeat protein
MKVRHGHARLYSILEVGTIVLALLLYLLIYRPKEKLEAEWHRANDQGLAALTKGNFGEARKDFQFSLEFGEKHKRDELDIADVRDGLADAERGLDNYQEALRLDELDQPVFEKYQTGCEGPYADFLAKFAGTYAQVGRYEEAEGWFRQALSLQEKTFGSTALQLVPTLNTMAYFYYDRNRDEIAEPLAKRSLAICQSHLGSKDPCTAYASSMLSLVYNGEGKFVEAEGLARQALPILESSYGGQSYAVASTLNRLGLALDGERRWPEAEAAFSRALDIRQELSGAQSNDLVVILHNLASLYDEEGKKQKAAAFRTRAEAISASRQDQAFSRQVSPAASTPKPDPSVTGIPTAGFAKDGVYTNNFFRFSIQFPQAWKILDRGSSIPQNGNALGTATGVIGSLGGSFVEAGYMLFWAATVDKQTQNQHWIVLCAFKLDSSRRNVTPEQFVRAEADAVRLGSAEYLKRGKAPPMTSGEPTVSRIAGRRIARLDEMVEIKRGATGTAQTNTVQLVMAQRGYLLWFAFSDPKGDESNNQAAKQIASLRFLGSAN